MSKQTAPLSREAREILVRMVAGDELRTGGMYSKRWAHIITDDGSEEIGTATRTELSEGKYIYLRWPSLGYWSLTVKGRKAAASN